jgi:hypothetical protein
MFFDALGRFALGQASVASSAIILPATAGAVAITGVAAAFADSFSAGAGAYSVSGVTVGFKDTIAAAAGSYSTAGNAAVLAGSLLAVSGSYHSRKRKWHREAPMRFPFKRRGRSSSD